MVGRHRQLERIDSGRRASARPFARDAIRCSSTGWRVTRRGCSTRSRRHLGLVDVKAAAAVRRELQDDGKALEHFTIRRARFRRKSSAATRPRCRRRDGEPANEVERDELARPARRDATERSCCFPASSSSGAFGRIEAALADARDQLATERATLARERVAVATAHGRIRSSSTSPISARGRCGRGCSRAETTSWRAPSWRRISATSRHQTRVWLQDANTRPALPASEGVRTLRVEIRAESDILGVLMFLAGAGARRQAGARRPARHFAHAAIRRERFGDAVHRRDDLRLCRERRGAESVDHSSAVSRGRASGERRGGDDEHGRLGRYRTPAMRVAVGALVVAVAVTIWALVRAFQTRPLPDTPALTIGESRNHSRPGDRRADGYRRGGRERSLFGGSQRARGSLSDAGRERPGREGGGADEAGGCSERRSRPTDAISRRYNSVMLDRRSFTSVTRSASGSCRRSSVARSRS